MCALHYVSDVRLWLKAIMMIIAFDIVAELRGSFAIPQKIVETTLYTVYTYAHAAIAMDR